jgi:hypothetical protein
MRIGERFGYFTDDPQRVVDRELPLAPEALPETLALHIGHGEPELAGCFA